MGCSAHTERLEMAVYGYDEDYTGLAVYSNYPEYNEYFAGESGKSDRCVLDLTGPHRLHAPRGVVANG